MRFQPRRLFRFVSAVAAVLIQALVRVLTLGIVLLALRCRATKAHAILICHTHGGLACLALANAIEIRHFAHAASVALQRLNSVIERNLARLFSPSRAGLRRAIQRSHRESDPMARSIDCSGGSGHGSKSGFCRGCWIARPDTGALSNEQDRSPWWVYQLLVRWRHLHSSGEPVMGRNTSISLGSHFTDFIDERVRAGRYASASEAVRAGMRLLEQEEAKLDLLRKTLAAGEAELDQGKGLDGEAAMDRLIG